MNPSIEDLSTKAQRDALALADSTERVAERMFARMKAEPNAIAIRVSFDEYCEIGLSMTQLAETSRQYANSLAGGVPSREELIAISTAVGVGSTAMASIATTVRQIAERMGSKQSDGDKPSNRNRGSRGTV